MTWPNNKALHATAAALVSRPVYETRTPLGCWQLIARKHHEAVRFFWDGRDGYITVESSPIRDSSAPNEWKQETAKGFDRVSGDDPLRFVES